MGRIASVGIAGLCACLIGACSSAGSAAHAPSALDPANIVPASAPVYVSITVRPQGTQASALQSALDAIGAGPGVRRLEGKFDRHVSKTGVNYVRDVRPWLGQRVAVAILRAPSTFTHGSLADDAVIIAPTSDPGAARTFVAARNRHLGADNTRGEVRGNYVLFGSPAALAQITTTSPADPLARDPTFTRATGPISGDGEMTAFVRPAAFVPAIRTFLSTRPGGAEFLPELAKVPRRGFVALGLGVAAKNVSFDVVSGGLPTRLAARGSGVADLPGSAWLAVSLDGLGALTKGSLTRFENSLPPGTPFGAAEQKLASLVGRLGAGLGPLRLAVSGSTIGALSAGLQMTPSTPGGETGLVTLLHKLAATKEPVSPIPGGFSITAPTGQKALVTQLEGTLVATFGGFTPQSFLHPSSTFGSSALYGTATSLLPSGSTVDLAVDFAPINALLTEFGHGAQAMKAERVLSRLRVLVAGGVPGHFRIALSLR